MVKPFPSKTHIGNHMLHPETLMLNWSCPKETALGL
jgi:methionine-gamma-lyase